MGGILDKAVLLQGEDEARVVEGAEDEGAPEPWWVHLVQAVLDPSGIAHHPLATRSHCQGHTIPL